MNWEGFHFLLAEGVVLRRDGAVIWPGDGSRQAIWDDWVARGAGAGRTRRRFTAYARVRRTLRLSFVPHPDPVLRDLVAYARGRRVGAEMVRTMLGLNRAERSERAFLDATVARVAAIQGSGRKVYGTNGPVDPELLWEIFPQAIRDRLRAHLAQRREPPIVPPCAHHVGRVWRLPDGPVRVLAAALLVDASHNRLSKSSRYRIASAGERYAAVLPAGGERDEASVSHAWREYAAGRIAAADPALTRQLTAFGYAGALNAAHAMAVLVLGAEAHLLTDLLPARQADEDDFRAERMRSIRLLKGATTLTREDGIVDLAARSLEVQVAADNRVSQAEGVLQAVLDALPEAEGLLAAGLRAGIEVRGPVVRPDGSLGRGEQVVSLRFELESSLLTGAARDDPSDRRLRAMLPAGVMEMRSDGRDHRPDRWSRIHVIYERTAAVEPGGEFHEPFWVDIYRYRLFETDRLMPDWISEGRRVRLLSAGLPLVASPVEGLLSPPRSRRSVVANVLASSGGRGPLVAPVAELYHALAYARLILLYGIRHGARFGETRQIRLGPDCFRTHPVSGVLPKGWGEHGKFGFDAVISAAVRQVKDFTVALWFPEERDERGRPSLPVTPFYSQLRDDLSPARYVFRMRDRMLDEDELLRFVRVLLIGVVDMATHAGRYLYATLLGLDGVDYQQLGALLHHRPNTFTARKYDLSGLITAGSAAERHNLRVDARMLSLVAGG